MKTLYIMLLTALLTTNIFAQSVDDYKYVVVPQSFDFLNTADQYQLNSLTVFLFKKYGFDAYKNGLETPAAVYENRCNVLYADVESDSNFTRTKLSVVLRDCNEKVIYVSEMGTSKEKRYKESYHEALRAAFLFIEELNYSYKERPQAPVDQTFEQAQDETVSTSLVQEEQPSDQNVVQRPQVITEDVIEEKIPAITYKSDNSAYRLVAAGSDFMIFDGDKRIGQANRKGENQYEIRTTEFSGKGKIQGENFLIDREIKGVGLVTMRFSLLKE